MTTRTDAAMLEALHMAAELVKVARKRFPKSIRNPDRYALELTSATINRALARATAKEV